MGLSYIDLKFPKENQTNFLFHDKQKNFNRILKNLDYDYADYDEKENYSEDAKLNFFGTELEIDNDIPKYEKPFFRNFARSILPITFGMTTGLMWFSLIYINTENVTKGRRRRDNIKDFNDILRHYYAKVSLSAIFIVRK